MISDPLLGWMLRRHRRRLSLTVNTPEIAKA